MTIPNVGVLGHLLTAMEECSTDMETKVGCVVTDPLGNILVTGANHHTSGVWKTQKNSTRPEKYDWIEHAERNAIYDAARRGIALEGASMHIRGFPCVECARAIAQAGIKNLYHGPTDGFDPVKYKFDKAKRILSDRGVIMVKYYVP